MLRSAGRDTGEKELWVTDDKRGKNFKDSGVVRVDAAKPLGGPRKNPADRASEKSLRAFARIHNVNRSRQLK